MKAALARLQTLANVAGAAALLWLVSPLLKVGERHPFDSFGARTALLLAFALMLLLALALGRFVAQRRNRRLFEQLQGADAAATGALQERFRAAMQMLGSGVAKDGSAATRWWRRRRQLYQLPWYLFIGAPGAGKTTALLHSGLSFPLAGRLGAAPVAGIGGTRQCDWWFSDRAVFLDTAGRYTTQDSAAATDAREWQLFLQLLRRYRPVQPINGVVVSVSVPDLLAGGAELIAQADAVERRLAELRSQLALRFPVYLLVTKADLLAGFVEFFGDYNAAERQQVWGVTFEHDSGGAAGPLPADLAARLAVLPANIAGLTTQRLQQEGAAQRRSPIVHFAAQLENLLPAIESFASRALRNTVQAPRQDVRGIYLSSGTQEGNPIDRVIGQLSRSYGLAMRPLARPDAGGKAYFLSALLQRLVIAEAPLAGTSLQRRRRVRALWAASGGAVAIVLLAACALWWLSYLRNADYVDAVRARIEQVTRQIGPAQADRIDELLPLYATLENMAANVGIDPNAAPLGFGFGLFQGPRLAQSARQTYHRVLDRTLAPLLAERLLHVVRQDGDAAARYDALRIYLMLVTPARMQRGEVRRWAAGAFATAPGVGAGDHAPGAGERQEWLRHLDALLERNAVQQAVQLDEAAVRAARKSLAAVPLAQRVHARVQRRTREQLGSDLSLIDLAGPRAVQAFASQRDAQAPSIPALYTRAAWQSHIEPALLSAIAEMADDAEWVLGDAVKEASRVPSDPKARDELASQVAKRHAQAAIAEWDRLLAGVKLLLTADLESLARQTSTLAGPNSPLRDLLRRLAAEFAPSNPPAPAGTPTAAFDAALAAHYRALLDYARAANGGALERLLEPLPTLAREPAAQNVAEAMSELRAEAARAPAPLREIWNGLAEALGVQQKRALARPAAGSLGELAETCRALVEDRFPFAPQGKRDMPHADFTRLFGPQGLLDAYFRNHLAKQIDTRARPWRVTSGSLSEGRTQTLRAFELADDIRRLFFAAGATSPRLQLQLTPRQMDNELLLFSVDVDGQLLRYENGPQRPKALTWPGPATTQRVLMRILPAGPSNVGAEEHEGPWALLRVMPRQSWQRGKGETAQVRLVVDSRSLALDVTSEAPVNPALIAELSSFRCPEVW